MEAGTAVHHGLGVLRDLPVEDGRGLVVAAGDGVLGADGETAGAAHALVRVDAGLAVLAEGGGAVGADPGTGMAAHALFLLDEGLAGVVLLHLAGPAAAAHADVLETSAHAGLLMPLEVGEGDEDIRVHDGPADLGLLHVFAACHGDGDLVVALEAVADEDVAAGGVGGEAVDVGGLDVVQGVLPSAHIEGVAVREEGLAALALHQVRHRLGPVGPQVCQVAGLTEVQLDGNILAVHIDIAEAGGHHQAGQLLGQVLPPAGGAEVCKIDLGCHSVLLCFSISGRAQGSSSSTETWSVPWASNSSR